MHIAGMWCGGWRAGELTLFLLATSDSLQLIHFVGHNCLVATEQMVIHRAPHSRDVHSILFRII